MIKNGILHIEYPTGEMNIVIDKFFPTTVERVTKLSKIIRIYVQEDEQIELYRRLKHLSFFYKEEAERYEGVIDQIDSEDESYKEAYAKLKDCQKKKAQLDRDIKAYLKTAKLEV